MKIRHIQFQGPETSRDKINVKRPTQSLALMSSNKESKN
jgi:hypothetical protein